MKKTKTTKGESISRQLASLRSKVRSADASNSIWHLTTRVRDLESQLYDRSVAMLQAAARLDDTRRAVRKLKKLTNRR
jgi:hypothetical protein